MSVQAAFCRYCGSRVITLKEDKLYAEVEPEIEISEEDHALLNDISKINTFDELMKIYDCLVRALTARVIGSRGDKFIYLFIIYDFFLICLIFDEEKTKNKIKKNFLLEMIILKVIYKILSVIFFEE
jgi:hypothetical protein